jgi:NAD(P)-dependent dehydrogenase (short-subunit alcohol dehydrogenase family)
VLIEQGAYVTAIYNTSQAEIQSDPELKRYMTGENARLWTCQVDATSEGSVDHFYKTYLPALPKMPALSCLVINHGVFVTENVPIWDMSLEQFERTLKINTTGPFLLIRGFLRYYKEYLGSASGQDESTSTDSSTAPPNIVLVGSTAAEFGEAFHSDYATSKSGLTHGMMKSVKNEIVKVHLKGRINTVAPGWVRTKMAEKSLEDERTSFMAMAT